MQDTSQNEALKHIAIIMDGNGRWANLRGFGRIRGHREGARRVDDIVSHCCELGIKYLTLYAFSTENWKRPSTEVSLLMRLLVQHLSTMDKKLIRNRVKLIAQGSLERLPHFVQVELNRVIRATNFENPNLTLNLSLSYGGRQEILDATKQLIAQVQSGERDPETLDEAAFSSCLYQPQLPDPDLLIRTGGEFRVSNFLLWQIAYAEIYVTDKLWPDFKPEALDEAIADFNGRQRRFGKTSEQVNQPHLGPGGLQ